MSSIIDSLRERIKDEQYAQRAFGLAISDENVQRALAEITNNHLIVTISSGSGAKARGIDFDLSDARYDTIGKLYQAVSRMEGYQANLDEDASMSHPSIDLEHFGPMDIAGVGLDMKHHVFSDAELERYLGFAVKRHNPGLTMDTLPDGEIILVIYLASADICRIQAHDATKRKGMDSEIFYLLEMANNFDRAYQKDAKRLSRAIVSPKESPRNDMREGDVVLGSLMRRSMRTGLISPMSQNLPPSPAELFDPNDEDVEDTFVRVRWMRNRDLDYYSFELWMDSRPDVARTREALLAAEQTYSAHGDAQMLRQSTSKLVYRSMGPNTRGSAQFTPTAFIGGNGSQVTNYVVDSLEPDTTYYFRAYIFDLNDESVASNVAEFRTKSLRTRFTETGTVVPVHGVATDLVLVNFDSTFGPITASHQLKMGEKTLAFTVITPTQAQITVPSFLNKGLKDLVVISPNSLINIRRNIFEVR